MATAHEEWPAGREFAEGYEARHALLTLDQWPRKLLERVAVDREDRVLDACCGTGVVARAVVPVVGPGRVIGVDSSPDMLAVARRVVGDAVEWRLGDATDLPLEDGSVDVVLCSHGLQHVADRATALSEFRRVTRLGGRLGVVQWMSDPEQLPYQAAVVAASDAMGWPCPLSGSAPGEMGDPSYLRRVVAEAGWQDVEVAPEVAVAPPAELGPRLELFYQRLAHNMAEAGAGAADRWRSMIEERLEPHHLGDGVYAIPFGAYVVTATAA